jgi:hypothetical protein
MKNVLKVITTAFIVILLAGCGTSAETSKNEDKNSGSGDENSGIVTGSIVSSLTEEVNDGIHHFVFVLKNDTTENVTLNMNSSQFFDYHLINDEGKIVYTYSDGKMHTQMLVEKFLPGETLEMKVTPQKDLLTLPEGTYTLKHGPQPMSQKIGKHPPRLLGRVSLRHPEES